LKNTGNTIRCQGSGRPRSARTDDNVDSVNKVILSQEYAPKSHRITRKISLFGIPYRSSEFEVEMLEEASCARTHCCKLCVASNARTKTATSFPSIRCGLYIFHWWAVKASGRHFEYVIWSSFTVLFCAFISHWLTNFSVGFSDYQLSRIIKDSRLKDKDQGLELKDRNQGLSTLPAFIMQQTRNLVRGQVWLGFCASTLFSSCVA